MKVRSLISLGWRFGVLGTVDLGFCGRGCVNRGGRFNVCMGRIYGMGGGMN
jgi:hypothetical protein